LNVGKSEFKLRPFLDGGNAPEIQY